MVALFVGTFVSSVQRLVPQFAADPDLVDRHAGEGVRRDLPGIRPEHHEIGPARRPRGAGAPMDPG
jgi:hypothetical protein